MPAGRATRCSCACGPTVRECALPREPFLRLIEANRVDQRVTRYETWEQLLGYCHALGRPRRGARAARVRCRHLRARGALGPDLHGAAAGRALAGRRRGSARGPRSTCRPRTWRASAAPRATSRAVPRHGALQGLIAFEVARTRALLRRRGAADRHAARARAAGSGGVRRRRPTRRSGRSSAPATTCSAVRRGPRVRGALRRWRERLAGSRRGEPVSLHTPAAYRQCEALTRAAAGELLLRHPPAPRRPSAGDVRGVRVRATRRRHRRRHARRRRRSCGGSTAAAQALERLNLASTPTP